MDKFQNRLQKAQKSMIRYIHVVLLISIAAGILVNYLFHSMVCAVFAGMGIFFLILLLVNYYSNRRYQREGVHTRATVTACERIKAEKGEEEEEGEDYYKITYEVIYEGYPVLVELPSGERARVGKSVGVYYIAGENVLRTDEEMGEFRSNKGLKILIAVSLGIALIAGITANFKAELFTEDFWTCVCAWLVALVFTLFGFGTVSSGLRHKRELSEARRVPARLTRFDVSTGKNSDGDSYKTYFPVWEYEDGGEYKEHKSSVSRRKKQEVGTVGELFLTAKGQVYEKSEEKSSFRIGLVFAVLGVGMIGVAILTTVQWVGLIL